MTNSENMKRILIINGPNINLLGLREPHIYGSRDYKALMECIDKWGDELGLKTECYQSNHEGAIVDCIQQAYGKYDGIIINPAAYTHTSVAILDALRAVSIPTVEVHLSNICEREEFRQHSFVSLYAQKVISGYGFDGYHEALAYFAVQK